MRTTWHTLTRGLLARHYCNVWPRVVCATYGNQWLSMGRMAAGWARGVHEGSAREGASIDGNGPTTRWRHSAGEHGYGYCGRLVSQGMECVGAGRMWRVVVMPCCGLQRVCARQTDAAPWVGGALDVFGRRDGVLDSSTVWWMMRESERAHVGWGAVGVGLVCVRGDREASPLAKTTRPSEPD